MREQSGFGGMETDVPPHIEEEGGCNKDSYYLYTILKSFFNKNYCITKIEKRLKALIVITCRASN
jgi:hypothetical protein